MYVGSRKKLFCFWLIVDFAINCVKYDVMAKTQKQNTYKNKLGYLRKLLYLKYNMIVGFTCTCVIDADGETWNCCSESIQTRAIVTSQLICADGIWTTYRWTEQTFIYI